MRDTDAYDHYLLRDGLPLGIPLSIVPLLAWRSHDHRIHTRSGLEGTASPDSFFVECRHGLLPSSGPSPSCESSFYRLFFQPGESLSYVIAWAGIPVGSATMENDTATPIERQPALRLVTTARSNKVLSKFFPVSNRVEYTVDAQSLLPFQLVFQHREGKRHDDCAITFDREEGRVRVI
ncbi:MAG: DUF3108 domain-containing protein [Nitrospirales bacterium]|nr:DUF3108 domain-containing protein [Nitrospirales bacterium]